MSSEIRNYNQWRETIKVQALEKNDKSVAIWSKYKNDLEVTKSLLNLIPKKISHSVMVPVGPKALMKGKIVHTNEFLVNLGETWFVKRSAFQTIEICDRRIKNCHEMLEKLEKERDLVINRSILPVEQEAFGSEERPEIIEYVTEEENEEWKKQHRIKEMKYRQQLAELRNKEKTPIESEEDLWKHLDDLELQEELEDELNRLNAKCSSEEDVSDEVSEDFNLNEKQNKTLETETNKENLNSKNVIESVKVNKRVHFACDLNSFDDEPLILEIKHSNWEPILSDFNSKEINSPADIYNQYLKLNDKKPLPVLKHDVNHEEKNNIDLIRYNDIFNNHDDNDEEEELGNDLPISIGTAGVYVNDITERNASSSDKDNEDARTKKISKFKLSRKKNVF